MKLLDERRRERQRQRREAQLRRQWAGRGATGVAAALGEDRAQEGQLSRVITPPRACPILDGRKPALGTVEEFTGMDALKKAVVLLWEYIHLLEKEYDDTRKEVDAIGDLVMRYIREAKVDESQHPETMAAILKVVTSFESSASHLESFNQERLKLMEAMNAVFTDLVINTTATRQ